MMRAIFMILLLSVAISSINPAKAQTYQPRLFLVGGALKTCSTMAIKNCTKKQQKHISAMKNRKFAVFYRLEKETKQRFLQFWPKNLPLSQRDEVGNLLNRMLEKADGAILDKSELRTLWRKYDHKNIITQLSDPAYYYFLDALEIPSTTVDGKNRRKEQVFLDQGKNPFAIELYRQFIQTSGNLSKRPQPNILVVTASSRDPFEAVDFYTQVFEQAGGNTRWLPLDATLQATWQLPGTLAEKCVQLPQIRRNIQGSAFREDIYPDLTAKQKALCLAPQKLVEQIQWADGIFFNGGDQSLTVQAFKDNQGNDYPVMAAIRQKLMNDKLVIGGTSAGTAVMSGGLFDGKALPMITNGYSEVAIHRGAKADQLPIEGCQKSGLCSESLLNGDLTYRSKGGLGLFNFGIMDTHFSERGRQGRLAQLVMDSQTRFGFGVDETTALVVSWPKGKPQEAHLSVKGQSGVYVVEQQKDKLLTHYLTRDDKALINNHQLTIEFAPWKINHQEKQQLPSNTVKVFRADTYQHLAAALCLSENRQVTATSKWQNKTSQIIITKEKNAAQSNGAIEQNGQKHHYCSYKNYQLKIHL